MGDLDLRFRAAGSSGWTDVSTAFHREEATVLQSDNDRCVTVLDSSRDRLFIAPFGLWITLDAGHLDSADFDPKTHVVRLHLGAANASVPVGRVRLTQTVPGSSSRAWTIASKPPLDAGANVIQLGPAETTVVLQESEQ